MQVKQIIISNLIEILIRIDDKNRNIKKVLFEAWVNNLEWATLAPALHIELNKRIVGIKLLQLITQGCRQLDLSIATKVFANP